MPVIIDFPEDTPLSVKKRYLQRTGHSVDFLYVESFSASKGDAVVTFDFINVYACSQRYIPKSFPKMKSVSYKNYPFLVQEYRRSLIKASYPFLTQRSFFSKEEFVSNIFPILIEKNISFFPRRSVDITYYWNGQSPLLLTINSSGASISYSTSSVEINKQNTICKTLQEYKP